MPDRRLDSATVSCQRRFVVMAPLIAASRATTTKPQNQVAPANPPPSGGVAARSCPADVGEGDAALPVASSASGSPAQTGQARSAAPPEGGGFAGATWFWGFVVVALLAAISGAMTTRRR